MKLKLERWIGRSQVKKEETNFQPKEKVSVDKDNGVVIAGARGGGGRE